MSKYKVPFVDFPAQYKKIKGEVNAAIQRCLDNGDYILRGDVEEFEKRLAEYVGTTYAVGVNSGTDALFLSLKAAGVGPGDEVITVSQTFIATIEAIVRCGAKPILVDVGQDMLMNTDQLAITEKTKAIIPVHFAGRVCDMDKIVAIAVVKDVAVIEDAAQALGASINRKKAGSFGSAGCFSFYPAKVLGGIGDGGAITTNSKEVAERIKLLRNHYDIKGQDKPETIDYGYNSRLDNIQAAVLNVKLNYLDDYIIKRRQLADLYRQGLAEVSAITLPSKEGLGEFWTYQDFIVLCWPGRDKLAAYLKENGVEVLVRDTTPNHLFEGLGLNHFELPMTERIADEALRLPIAPELTEEQVKYVIKKIKEFYA